MENTENMTTTLNMEESHHKTVDKMMSEGLITRDNKLKALASLKQALVEILISLTEAIRNIGKVKGLEEQARVLEKCLDSQADWMAGLTLEQAKGLSEELNDINAIQKSLNSDIETSENKMETLKEKIANIEDTANYARNFLNSINDKYYEMLKGMKVVKAEGSMLFTNEDNTKFLYGYYDEKTGIFDLVEANNLEEVNMKCNKNYSLDNLEIGDEVALEYFQSIVDYCKNVLAKEAKYKADLNELEENKVLNFNEIQKLEEKRKQTIEKVGVNGFIDQIDLIYRVDKQTRYRNTPTKDNGCEVLVDYTFDNSLKKDKAFNKSFAKSQLKIKYDNEANVESIKFVIDREHPSNGEITIYKDGAYQNDIYEYDENIQMAVKAFMANCAKTSSIQEKEDNRQIMLSKTKMSKEYAEITDKILNSKELSEIANKYAISIDADNRKIWNKDGSCISFNHNAIYYMADGINDGILMASFNRKDNDTISLILHDNEEYMPKPVFDVIFSEFNKRSEYNIEKENAFDFKNLGKIDERKVNEIKEALNIENTEDRNSRLNVLKQQTKELKNKYFDIVSNKDEAWNKKKEIEDKIVVAKSKGEPTDNLEKQLSGAIDDYNKAVNEYHTVYEEMYDIGIALNISSEERILVQMDAVLNGIDERIVENALEEQKYEKVEKSYNKDDYDVFR